MSGNFWTLRQKTNHPVIFVHFLLRKRLSLRSKWLTENVSHLNASIVSVISFACTMVHYHLAKSLCVIFLNIAKFVAAHHRLHPSDHIKCGTFSSFHRDLTLHSTTIVHLELHNHLGLEFLKYIDFLSPFTSPLKEERRYLLVAISPLFHSVHMRLIFPSSNSFP